MKITKKILPGMNGTKKLVETYRDNLVCVRYREDPERNLRLKTVELIVDTGPLVMNTSKVAANKVMHLRVNYGEADIGKAIKSAGGRWNREKGVWELPYKAVKALSLENRIVKEQ